MKTLIENSITWARLSGHPKENYTFSIERAVLGRQDNILTIRIRLNFVVPFSDVEKIEAICKSEVEGLSGVRLEFIYEDVILTPKEVIALFIEHMIRIVNGSYAPITKTIFPEKFQFEDGRLTIYAVGETSVALLNEQVASKFSHLLMENFGIEADVLFQNHKESCERTYREIEEKEKKDAEENRRQQLKAAQNAPKESSGGGFRENGGGAPWGEEKTVEPEKR